MSRLPLEIAKQNEIWMQMSLYACYSSEENDFQCRLFVLSSSFLIIRDAFFLIIDFVTVSLVIIPPSSRHRFRASHSHFITGERHFLLRFDFPFLTVSQSSILSCPHVCLSSFFCTSESEREWDKFPHPRKARKRLKKEKRRHTKNWSNRQRGDEMRWRDYNNEKTKWSRERKTEMRKRRMEENPSISLPVCVFVNWRDRFWNNKKRR